MKLLYYIIIFTLPLFRVADYGLNSDRISQQHSRSKHRSRQHQTAGSSRWDNSPDDLPLGASAQSLMLSQTTWSDEPPQTPLLPQVQINCIGDTLRRISSGISCVHMFVKKM